jgi:Antibiotic biosynthesis monooxygenase
VDAAAVLFESVRPLPDPAAGWAGAGPPYHGLPGGVLVESVLVATRAFPGCLGVDVLVDTEDEAHLPLIEKWESIEHDQAYRDWRATDAAPLLRGAARLPCCDPVKPQVRPTARGAR